MDAAWTTPRICHGAGVAHQTADLDNACGPVFEVDANEESALRKQLEGARPILGNGGQNANDAAMTLEQNFVQCEAGDTGAIEVGYHGEIVGKDT